MKAILKVTRTETLPEEKQQREELFYTLVVDGVEVCGNRASAFYSIRDAVFSLAHSAAIILGNGMDGRDVEYNSK